MVDPERAFVASSDRESMTAELRRLLASAIDEVMELVDWEQAWEAPLADSEAGSEMAAENASRETQCWPWLLAGMFSRSALQVAVEHAKGLRTVIAHDATSYPADVLCRGVLECCSLAWWLLEPQIGPERRLCRVLVYRLHTAWQTEQAVATLDIDAEEDRSEYGELPPAVEKEIADLGLDFRPKRANVKGGRPRGPFSCGEEKWLSYASRTEALVGCFWREPRMPYAVLSAVAHGELLGLSRTMTWRGGERQSRPAVGDAELWLWHDAYLTLGAVIFTACRAAGWLGLRERLAALDALTGTLDDRLPKLRPQP